MPARGQRGQPPREGQVFAARATQRTVAGAQVDFFRKQHGQALRLAADSRLHFDELGFRDTGRRAVITRRLDLQKGCRLGDIQPLAAGSRYEIRTPKGVIRSQGGFGVRAEAGR